MQEAVATRVRHGGAERLLLLEHDPVYTIGRRGTTDHLLVGLDVLRADGASVYRVDRGGDITYHGPGQLVGYPITAFAEGADLVAYVRAIEEALRDALGSYGVSSRTERGKTGVWVDLPDGRPAKIAAIGVPISRRSSVCCPAVSGTRWLHSSGWASALSSRRWGSGARSPWQPASVASSSSTRRSKRHVMRKSPWTHRFAGR